VAAGTDLSRELRDAAPFVAGAMWAAFAIVYAVFYLHRYAKTADFFLYASAFVLVPVVGFLALLAIRKHSVSAGQRVALETFVLAAAAASTFLPGPRSLLALVALLAIAAALELRAGAFSARAPEPVWRWAGALSAIALLLGFLQLLSTNVTTYLYWPYRDVPMVSWGMDITEHKPNRWRVLAGFVAVLAVIYASRLVFAYAGPRLQVLLAWAMKYRNVLWIAMALLLGYAILQPDLYPNAHHHNAYLGPRHLMFMGGWPLVDVFCQYGLAYLAFLPLGTLLPFNYESAALVSNLFDISMMVAALAMIRHLAGNRRFAIPLAAAFFLIVWLVMPYNLSYTPSVFGVRWLPVWLLTLAFVVRPVSATYSVPVLILLNICALWSIETHLVSLIVAVFYFSLVSRIGGATLPRALLDGAKALPLSLLGHIAFALLTLAVKGQLPEYSTYLEILGAYQQSDNISWFLLSAEKIIVNVWLLFVIVYAFLMFLALASFAAGKPLLLEPRLLIGLCVIAAEGIAQGLYFIGRPTQPLLALVGLPLYTILACGFLYLLDHISAMRRVPRELTLLGSLGALAFLGGVAYDRAMMDINSGKMGSTNDTMLLKCLRFGECNPLREIGRLARELRNPSSLAGDTPGAKQQTDAMVALYRRWQPTGSEIISLSGQRTTAYIELGVRDRLPISNFYNDRLSPTLMARAAKAIETLPAGSLVITIDDMSDYDLPLLCGLNKRFTFEQVDAIRDTRVERLNVRNDLADLALGKSIEQRDGKRFLPLKDGRLAPIEEGLGGFVERAIHEKNDAILSGWAIDETGPALPGAVIITIRDRVFASGSPRIERKDIASLHANYLNSGFRLLVCDVSKEDIATMRAFASLSDGSVRELRYSAGVRHGASPK